MTGNLTFVSTRAATAPRTNSYSPALEGSGKRLPMDQSVQRLKSLSAVCQAIVEGDTLRATSILQRVGDDGFAGLGDGKLGESPVMLALSTGHPKLAHRIIDAGYQPDLWEAAALGDARRVHEFALNDPDRLNLCNPDGWSAMHLACYAHAAPVLAVLCEMGADPNVIACNSTFETPLHSAVRTDDPETIETLLATGADQRFPDGAGRTPLQLAIELSTARAGEALAAASV